MLNCKLYNHQEQVQLIIKCMLRIRWWLVLIKRWLHFVVLLQPTPIVIKPILIESLIHVRNWNVYTAFQTCWLPLQVLYNAVVLIVCPSAQYLFTKFNYMLGQWFLIERLQFWSLTNNMIMILFLEHYRKTRNTFEQIHKINCKIYISLKLSK